MNVPADESTGATGERIVLRAELFERDQHVVAHTIELSPAWVSVRTDAHLDLGAAVRIRLSFARLLPPVELEARVVSRDGGSGHGYQAGYRLELLGSPEARARLRPLLVRLEPDAAVTRRCRILLVEDSAVMRDSVEHGASRASGPVEVVASSTASSEDALAMIEREPPDLALIDHFLPGPWSGADLVRELRARGLDVPVIGYSIGGAAARDAFLAAGADLFLDKPVILRDVFRTLQRLTMIGTAAHADLLR